MLKILKMVSDYIDANVYVVKNEEDYLIIDSGVDLNIIKNIVGENKVVGVLLTHGHYDHSRFCVEYAKEFNCKIYANKNVTGTLFDKDAIYSPNGELVQDLSRFIFIEGDTKLKLGNFEIDCFYCPGHCKCCQCYLIEGNLFAGDVLFDRGMGRIDLKTSNKEEMLNSLAKLEKIKFNTLYSGHGDESDFNEQQRNIYICKRFLKR